MDSISKAFEEFLRDRLSVDIPGGNLEKWSTEEQRFIGDLDLEQELKDAGVNEDKVTELYDLVNVGIGEIAETAYVNGVKEGFELALHLLPDGNEAKEIVRR
jgi:hypothetical protein